MAGYRTPLGSARGLGSAKHGVSHFIAQRVSAVALLFLTLWGVLSALAVAGSGFDGAKAWLASPLNAAPLVLLVVTGFYHAHLGMRVVIEDYIGRHSTRAALLVLNLFVAAGGAVLAALCVLKVALGGGVV